MGGGDSFASGLIYGLLAGKDPPWALDCGVAHGALAMSTPGDTSMASLAEVLRAMDGAERADRPMTRTEHASRAEIIRRIEERRSSRSSARPRPSWRCGRRDAILAGGISVFEITMTVPDAPAVIRALVHELGERALVGAGTVLNAAAAAPVHRRRRRVHREPRSRSRHDRRGARARRPGPPRRADADRGDRRLEAWAPTW